MDTSQIRCTLRNVKSFLGVYPSDLLPASISRSGTVIVNTDPHTERGSHWLAIHLEPRSSSAYYFDSYGIVPFIPDIRDFLKRTCTVWYHNSTQLQGLMSTVCGHYCCVFALYMDRGFTPQQFVRLFNTESADKQIDEVFTREFGPLREKPRGGQCCFSIYKRYVPTHTLFISNLNRDLNGGGHRLRSLVWERE